MMLTKQRNATLATQRLQRNFPDDQYIFMKCNQGQVPWSPLTIVTESLASGQSASVALVLGISYRIDLPVVLIDRSINCVDATRMSEVSLSKI